VVVKKVKAEGFKADSESGNKVDFSCMRSKSHQNQVFYVTEELVDAFI